MFSSMAILPHNFIMDSRTLQVKALIDWEYAGFYPEGMEGWPGTLDEASYRMSKQKTAYLIGRFLTDEYLECYHNWDDQEELVKLVKLGELPDPEKLR